MNRHVQHNRQAAANARFVMRFVTTALTCICISTDPAVAADGGADPVAASFNAADANHDGMLSLEEYRTLPGGPEVQQRDFRLFDFDRNRTLTPAEFAAIPGRVPASQRGALPDPFDHLVAAAAASIATLFKSAPRSDTIGIEEKIFVDTVLGTLSPEDHYHFNSRWIRQADPSRDGQVTHAEARRFVEIHLGVRAPSGDLLRMSDGRVLQFGWFLKFDANGNNVLEEDELPGDSRQKALQLIKPLDRNADGAITLPEYTDPDGSMFADPVARFRAADMNLDALLDRSEAEAATEEFRQVLVPMAFAAFDDSGDGKLTLDEYRLSMLGNPAYAWENVPKDENDDGRLTFEEFRFDHAECELLRLYYFHRLDKSGDSKLTKDEYPFRMRPAQKLHLLAADGSLVRELFVNEEFVDIGSPAASPDGTRIAFDGHRRGQSLQQQRILMTSIDGSGFEDVCAGLMPTWSKDGKRFACSRYEPRTGIWIVNADGSGARRISDGWAAQWSPDGRNIAFTKNYDALWVHDVAADQSREVLSAAKHPYRLIYWNMCWSPDSRRLVFKARTARGHDVASVNMDSGEPDLRVHYSTERAIKEDPAWSPDGSRVVIALQLPQHHRQLLCEFDPRADEQPRVLEKLDRSLTYEGCCFTPDGKWIIVQTDE